MALYTEEMTIYELLKVAADHHKQLAVLSEEERQGLIVLLKKKGEEELEYGQEIECEGVRLVKRVTGALGVYFQ
jgi:hypothetical protein